MQIDKNQTYVQNSYKFVNFVHITDIECESVLSWRNDDNIRKWMYNTERIDLNSHKAFVETLSKRNDRFYWLVKYDDEPMGVVNIVNVDYNSKSAELGYYVRPDYMATGLGLDFVYNVLSFALLVLRIDTLYGSVNINNKGAYIIDMYLGFRETGRKVLALGSEFINCYITPELFLTDNDLKRDIKLFIKYIKKYGTK